MSTSADEYFVSTSSLAGKYLTVTLGQEGFGIAVPKVREIIRLQKITPVPQAPPCVKGVINLRGRVIPVMDLRVKLGLAAALADRTCIVVVQIALAAAPVVQMGLVVDSVEEVVTLREEQIEVPPDFGVSLDADYLLGLAKAGEAVTLLLDIDRVVAPETLARLLVS